MKALVTAEFSEDGTRRLAALGYHVTRAGWGVTRKTLDPVELATAATGAVLLITELETVDAAVLDAVPTLRLVATARGGPVNVDLAACAARHIPVIYTPGRNADSVADFVVGTMLSLIRCISRSERHLRDTGWHVGTELPYLHFRGPELARLSVGIVGNGAVGQRVAKRLTGGFGTNVVIHDPLQGIGPSLPDLLAHVDVVSLHCPRSPATIGLIDAPALHLLGPNGYLINTAGGGIVDEDALCDALDTDQLAGAALDVFTVEPLPPDSRLLRTPRLLLTPHLAGAADDVVSHHTDLICQDIERWHRGEPLTHDAIRPAG